jgi:hypothetical protein
MLLSPPYDSLISNTRFCIDPDDMIDHRLDLSHTLDSTDSLEDDKFPCILLDEFSHSPPHDICSEILSETQRELCEVFSSIGESEFSEDLMKWIRESIDDCSIFFSKILSHSSLPRAIGSRDDVDFLCIHRVYFWIRRIPKIYTPPSRTNIMIQST